MKGRGISLLGAGTLLAGGLAVMSGHTVAHAASLYTVYTGYADARTPASTFPNPWPDTSGSLPAGTVLYGDAADAQADNPDVAAVRIDNTSSVPMVVNDVTANCGSSTFNDFGGPGAAAPLAAGGTLIVVGQEGFDGSDASCSSPVTVLVTVDGVQTTYNDNQVSANPQGSALLGCANESCSQGSDDEDQNESLPWTQIGVMEAPSPSPTPTATPAGAVSAVNTPSTGSGGPGPFVGGALLVLSGASLVLWALHRKQHLPLP